MIETGNPVSLNLSVAVSPNRKAVFVTGHSFDAVSRG
jgi:hypothetical protein